MTFTPPPSAKESGVRWLGRIPAHWAVVPSRRLFSERNERAKVGDEQLTVSQKYGLISQTDFMRLEGRRIVQVLKGHDILKHTEAGDFVMSMRSFQGGLEYSGLTGAVSSAYVPLKPIKWVHPGFFRHLFKSSAYIQELQSTSDLVRDGQALRFENFSKVALPVVPLPEQAAIAAYLDRATARIEALIAKKTRFIELLREKRSALISRAVTKGLDAGAPLKESNVKWLGDVPTRWSVCRTSFRFTVDLGKMLDEKKRLGLYPVPYLRNQDVQWEGINSSGLPVMDIAPGELDRYTARSGDLLVCEGGDVGRASIWNGPPIGYQKALHRLRPLHGDKPEFMRLALMAAKSLGAFEETDAKSTISHLPAEKLRLFKFPFPPIAEQNQIVLVVDQETARLDALTAKTERSIALLREHRTALISAAVTGKIDLCAVARRTA